MRPNVSRALLALSLLSPCLLSLSCEAPTPTGEGLFLEGCPVPGESLARVLTRPDEKPTGPHVIAAPGDVMLANERAAFVITQPGESRTYWYYGGILVDAVAVDGCRQAAPERFGELAPLAGGLNLTAFDQSVLRGFHGERIEIVNDGADGKAAVVRATGRDDLFWLIEMELQRRSWADGRRKETTQPLGIGYEIDYVLAPGSSVLEIVLRLRNKTETQKTLLTASALFLGDTTPMPDRKYFDDMIKAGGLKLGFGAPWIVAGERDGSYAFALDTQQMGTTEISGVHALIDIGAALERPLILSPAGSEGDAREARMWVSVGATDRNSATRELLPLMPGGRDYTPVPVAGSVRESDGTPLDNATVEVMRQLDDGTWASIDQFRTKADGTFAGTVPDYGDQRAWRFAPRLPGRTPPAPADLVFPADASRLDFAFERAGALGYIVEDSLGNALPAKITVLKPDTRRNTVVQTLFTTEGRGEAPVEPGDYRVVFTRGYEYAPVERAVTIVAGRSIPVQATLERVVDTSGFLSMDGHVHQEPSEDSTVDLDTRFAGVAAEGLEVMVATDHEIIRDLAASPEALRLAKWFKVMNGEEVTATTPEHMNMWGVPPRPDAIRGDPVRWYGKDLPTLVADQRARGARVITLNHPREIGSCGWLCQIDFDRLTGQPRVTDPTTFGLAPGAQLWSWDFDAVELLNGMKDIFLRKDPRDSGKFDDWMAFHNLGHRITGVAVTDIHDEVGIGNPRTYFAAPTDDPAAFEETMLEESVKKGRVLLSAGAFARVAVNGKGMGETATAVNGQIDIAVRVEAIPAIDVKTVKVFVNCDEVKTLTAPTPGEVVKLDTTLPLSVPKDAHVVLVGFGTRQLPAGFEPVIRATPRFITNPVYVDADGDGLWTPPGGKSCTYTAPK